MTSGPGVDFAEALGARIFLTGGGTETHLLFQQRFPLREFCAFEVFEDEAAVGALEESFLFPILDAAHAHGHGLLLDALVWRAQPDFVAGLGYPSADLARVNRRAVARTRQSVESWRGQGPDRHDVPVAVAADIGPRGDGYRADGEPAVDEALAYHQAQLEVLADAGIDVVVALTMTTANEAIGIARAAARIDVPLLVSPTVETDGRLPDGSSLAAFVRKVDDATSGGPLFYMVNCAHPSHLADTLEQARRTDPGWLGRLRGLRANASRKSHAELDEATELDRGDCDELARELSALQAAHDLRIVGGCCGTDAEHITRIAEAVRPAGAVTPEEAP